MGPNHKHRVPIEKPASWKNHHPHKNGSIRKNTGMEKWVPLEGQGEEKNKWRPEKLPPTPG
jgi:hypothetical protein